MIKPQTLKGFRDFLPNEARKRQYVIDTLKNVFISFGFEPLETPALEYEEILTGKYGDEGDKLMYRFEDNGKRRVALRYDQTVPTARVVAQYAGTNDANGRPLLPFPFKRYQIQPVWRAENTQKGRYREFLQCDADSIGTTSPLADAEILTLVTTAVKAVGFSKFKILINDRTLFASMTTQAVTIIDKLKKIGEEGVINELVEKQQAKTKEDAQRLLDSLRNAPLPENLKTILEATKSMGISEENIQYEPTLARGLDYYTGLIFEVEIDGYTAGSVCGGGRYDNLIGMFAGRQIPAVGFAFGFDRLIDAMEQMSLFPTQLQKSGVFVTIFSPELKVKSLEISTFLRVNNIHVEVYLDETVKMEKQLRYANQKGIQYVIIIGPDEATKNTVQLKNMQTRDQKEISIKDLISFFS